MIQKVKIEAFLALAEQYPVLDVRSPGEYGHAAMPGAFSFPLFTDEERKVVGTAYKQVSREDAIKIGLDYFGGKMRHMIEEVECIVASWPKQYLYTTADEEGKPPKKTVLVHCWRGGMRTTAVAWLLDLYGFKVYTLDGGYKAFRNWVLAQFELPYPFKVIGGYTGAGKTPVLHELAKRGEPIIDLEGIANHKGSAFGGFDGVQPTQEMFENRLALELHKIMQHARITDGIWIEDESQRIGLVNVPHLLWNTMHVSSLYFLDMPFEERLNHITEDYGKYSKELLVNAVIRIQKRLGGQGAKDAINCLLENDIKGAFRILLAYYDKYYHKGLGLREDNKEPIIHIPCATVSAVANSQLLVSLQEQQ